LGEVYIPSFGIYPIPPRGNDRPADAGRLGGDFLFSTGELIMTVLQKWMVLAATCAVVSLLVSLSSAENDKARPASGEEAAKPDANARSVEELAAAYRLAEIGDKYESPEALVAAGALLLRLQASLKTGKLGELDLKPEVLDEKEKPIEGAKVESPKPESLEKVAKKYFDQASTLALKLGVSKEVEDEIKAVKARTPPSRGAINGPRQKSGVLHPGQSHSFSFTFLGYSALGFQATAPVRVQLNTGGVTHFNQLTGVGQYSWMPRGKQGAHVLIHNPHRFAVTYNLMTN